MTAPELVEVVAAALDTHVRIKSQTLHQECLCGWVGGLLGYDHCAHQAAAVLAALTEAGTVEWGALTRGRKVPYRYVKEQDARNSAKANHGVFVSRLTFPWTAVGK